MGAEGRGWVFEAAWCWNGGDKVEVCAIPPSPSYLAQWSGGGGLIEILTSPPPLGGAAPWETKGLEKLKQMKAHFDVVLACSYNADGCAVRGWVRLGPG